MSLEASILSHVLYSFAAFFAIVDPIGNVPIFQAVLERFEKDEREDVIKKSVTIAAAVLVFFTLGGRYVFRLLNIEIYSFKIAGGILLFIISVEMLFGKKTRTESSFEEEDEARIKEDIATTPLAVPLLTGPGAITTGIVLFSSATTLAERSGIMIAIFLVFLASYLILAKSKDVFELLGTTGTRVIVRVMGLLLAAIAVQFVITGVGEAAKSIGLTAL